MVWKHWNYQGYTDFSLAEEKNLSYTPTVVLL